MPRSGIALAAAWPRTVSDANAFGGHQRWGEGVQPEPPSASREGRGEPNPDEASKVDAKSKRDSVGVTIIATR